MSELTIQRTPELIAAEINNIKDQTRHMVLYNSIEIGRRLVEAKSLIEHGEWGNWLGKSVDYSQRTANNLMRIFNEYGSEQISLLNDNAKSQAIANLSYTQAITLLEVPEEEREDFIKENDAENKSARELQKLIKERDEAKKAAEEAKKIAEQKEEESKKRALEVERLTISLIEEKEKYKKQQEKLKSINEKIKAAEASGNSEEVEKLRKLLKKAEDDMSELSNKNKELEEQLKDKPIDVQTVTKEVIPDEIQKELQDLRDKKNRSMNDEKVIKFKVQFNELSRKFKDLLIALSDMEESAVKVKCKNAVNVLISEMAKKL